MNLYEIDARLSELIDPETGEVLDFEEFEKLQMAREEKAEGIALWIKDLIAEAKAISEEVESLQKRKASAARKAERLKGYLQNILRGEKFSTARCAVTYRHSRYLEVEDEECLAAWLKDHYADCLITKESISRDAVKNLMKAGISVPFARMEERESIGVR